MVHNVVKGTYTETYDLNTINNQLSILGIHTPLASSLKRMFHGYFEQYSKFRVLGCNFRMVCASQQSLDPTLVGMESGQIDPRDVLNPVLFKACTGEGMNVLLDQIYNRGEEVGFGVAATGSVSQHIDDGAAINAYYALLADDSFRREHPQKGITVMGLKPYVHRIVTTQPFKWNVAAANATSANNGYIGDRPVTNSNAGTPPEHNDSIYGAGGQSGSKTTSTDPVNGSVFVSNGLADMPWMDTAFSQVVDYVDPVAGTTASKKKYTLATNVPRVYMGVLVLPPSTSMNLYFRLQIVWHIAFKDFRAAQDILPYSTIGDIPSDVVNDTIDNYSDTYFNLYHTASKLDKEYGSFDTTGVEQVDLVNEKVQ